MPQVFSWSFPFSPGIRPSTCTLTVPAQTTNPAARGRLRLSWNSPTGGAEGIDFPDCVLEQPPVSASASGTTARLPIKDRRHWWQFGHISGSYNVKRPDGRLTREKTPVELAKLCLEAMGEKGYVVDALPAAPRPPITWDHANPAAELDRLCQSYGCMVVLNPRTNKVEIWAEGNGDDPPERPTLGRSNGFSLLAAPKSLLLVGRPTVFDSLFYCEAVGEDTDGTIKRIGDLSYKPATGWTSADITFYDMTGTYTRDGERRKIADLARACVFKMYRIVGLVGGGKWSPRILKGTDLEPRSLDDIKLLQERATSAADSEGIQRKEPPRAYVQSWEEGEEQNSNESPKVATTGFTIDAARGLVIFSQPQVRIFEDFNLPAKVWLRTGFHAGRDGVLHRYTRERNIPGGRAEAGARVEKRELTRTITEQWVIDINTPAQAQFRRVVDNAATVHKDADAQLDAMAKAYKLQTSPTRTYPGIVPSSPNGRIQQITWQYSDGGASTTISAGSRHNPYIPTLEDQRRDRDAKELADMLQAGVIKQQAEQAEAVR